MTKVVNFVCDRLPDPDGCRFIELENDRGESVGDDVGVWHHRNDGLVELRVALSQPPIIQALHDNAELIALQATVAQQAQMIEYLRGGPTPLYTAVDMANAARDGFRDGAASVVVSLPPPYPVPEEPEDAIDDSFMDAYTAATGMRHACKQAIIAAGGSVKDE